MGQDKARLEFRGMSLLTWQIRRLEHAGFRVFHSITDNFPGYLGPLAGIEAALTLYPEETSWLVLPVDMPGLTIETMQDLMNSPMHSAAVLSFKGHPFPLVIQKPPEVRLVVRQWLADPHGRRSVKALIEYFDGISLDEPVDKKQFNNINTPEQWRQFKEVELT
jgi:molybdopterin-guanine dinucleotide biosynthesis protein A